MGLYICNGQVLQACNPIFMVCSNYSFGVSSSIYWAKYRISVCVDKYRLSVEKVG